MDQENKHSLGNGALLSLPDYRDGYVASAVIPAFSDIALPASYETVLAPPMMQAKEPACVSHSVVENLKLYWFRKTRKWIDFSPRFLDILVKRFDGQDRVTGGTYPRLVFKLAVQYGCATTATLPNDTSLPVLEYRDDSKLTKEVFAEAARYKIPGYVSIPLDFQTTRQAIYLYGVTSMLFSVGDTLYTSPDGNISWADKDIDPLRPPKTVTSGHQMSPKGWTDDTYNKLRNEWSAAWADNGDIRYDPKAWSPFVFEQWAVAEIPPNVQNLLKSLPAPKDFHYQWNTNLAIGDHNDDVGFAQIAFMILGFLAPVPANELGIFGPKTATANGKFQQAHRITPSPNNIGPQTRAVLNNQFAV
jgi:hypothetical protein